MYLCVCVLLCICVLLCVCCFAARKVEVGERLTNEANGGSLLPDNRSMHASCNVIFAYVCASVYLDSFLPVNADVYLNCVFTYFWISQYQQIPTMVVMMMMTMISGFGQVRW